MPLRFLNGTVGDGIGPLLSRARSSSLQESESIVEKKLCAAYCFDMHDGVHSPIVGEIVHWIMGWRNAEIYTNHISKVSALNDLELILFRERSGTQ